MKSHYCKYEKAVIEYEGQCNWCKEKEMNKPVAWMSKSGFEYQQVKEDFSYKEKEGWIPLYTHPVKELTDEEIGQIYEELYEMKLLDKYPLDFARAILRKAQEK